MSDKESVVDVVVAASARVHRQLQLGKVTEHEAVSDLRTTVWNDPTARLDIQAVPVLPEAGRRAVETIRDEPLIVAAMWQGLLQWIPISLAEQVRRLLLPSKRRGTSGRHRKPVRNAVKLTN
ncbi:MULTISPECIES: hypothetical protein [unclassified Dietzia]|uniref:hypothetical protein n=1 Tax=unclassified Dietzia TaxID=2617939 RepID=UPI000D20A71B|nr:MULTISPECIES: hypothetical protein [unclassified Dietzia]AVZ38477.1 hypothetical protein CT688_02215 [Dietzia sp. JS16-p6b]